MQVKYFHLTIFFCLVNRESLWETIRKKIVTAKKYINILYSGVHFHNLHMYLDVIGPLIILYFSWSTIYSDCVFICTNFALKLPHLLFWCVMGCVSAVILIDGQTDEEACVLVFLCLEKTYKKMRVRHCLEEREDIQLCFTFWNKFYYYFV